MRTVTQPTVYGSVTVGSKGQVVIPIKLREEMHINPGDTLIILGSPVKGAFNVLKAETILALQRDLAEIIPKTLKRKIPAPRNK